MTDLDLDALAEELSDFDQPEKKGGRSAREERVIAGFEDIQRFVDEHGRAPLHGEGRDIFERLYAVRLDRLRELSDCREILRPLDRQGLLGAEPELQKELEEDELFTELEGVDELAEIEKLVHVRPIEEIKPAEDVASRKTCVDFERYQPVFEQARQDLERGSRETRRFAKTNRIELGDVFILGGQMGLVAEFGEEFIADYKIPNRRLRLIFDNGMESNMLLRSLQRALYKDKGGRRVTAPEIGPLFGDIPEEGDLESGTIYVLRSMSTDPRISANREVIHKIGVTGGDVKVRIAQAKDDPTFLLADVEIVATYKLSNIGRAKLENLLHRFFERARLDLEMKDRFGKPFCPREWFLTPLDAIDEAVKRIRDGSIARSRYDVGSARVIDID